MDQKSKEALEGVYRNLTDEQKKKADLCESVEDCMKFIEDEGIELPEELLADVAGGFDCFEWLFGEGSNPGEDLKQIFRGW